VATTVADPIKCNLHVIAGSPGVLAACRHRARVRIGRRDLVVPALHHLRVERIEPDDLWASRQMDNLLKDDGSLARRIDGAGRPDLDHLVPMPRLAQGRSARRVPAGAVRGVRRDHDIASRCRQHYHGRAELYAWGGPFMADGLWSGFRLFGKIDDETFRKTVAGRAVAASSARASGWRRPALSDCGLCSYGGVARQDRHSRVPPPATLWSCPMPVQRPRAWLSVNQLAARGSIAMRSALSIGIGLGL
jgi:hypothetical protein